MATVSLAPTHVELPPAAPATVAPRSAPTVTPKAEVTPEITPDALHSAFTPAQIKSFHDEDLTTAYRVSAVLIAAVTFGVVLGTIGMLLALRWPVI